MLKKYTIIMFILKNCKISVPFRRATDVQFLGFRWGFTLGLKHWVDDMVIFFLDLKICIVSSPQKLFRLFLNQFAGCYICHGR